MCTITFLINPNKNELIDDIKTALKHEFEDKFQVQMGKKIKKCDYCDNIFTTFFHLIHHRKITHPD